MMKIKLNWGKGLILGMGAFVLFITTLGVFMFRQSPDDYDHQYYEKGLAYDSVYNQERAVVLDKVQPRISFEQNNMRIEFAHAANGTIHFERLADPSLDKVIPFQTLAGPDVNVDLAKFKKGRWDITFNWTSRNKKYIYQKKIDLP